MRLLGRAGSVGVYLCLACGCQPPAGQEDGGTSNHDADTEEEEEEEEEDEGDEDVPPDMEQGCIVGEGTAISLDDAVWSAQDDSVRGYTSVIQDSRGRYLVGIGSPEWNLSRFDRDSGLLETSELQPLHGNTVVSDFAWTEDGELVALESDGHAIRASLFDGVENAGTVSLEDDHPRVGWDGGASQVIMAVQESEQLVVFGKSWGDENPEGGATLQAYWRKRYSPESGELLAVDFEQPEESGKSESQGVWRDSDFIFGQDQSRLVRWDAKGDVAWSLDGFESLPRVVSDHETELVVRHASDEGVESLSVVDPAVGGPLETLWSDNHCTPRFAYVGLLTQDGASLVLSAATVADTGVTIWVEQVERETGESTAVRSLTVPAGISLAPNLSEDESGTIHLLLYGGEESGGEYEARAWSLQPFE